MAVKSLQYDNLLKQSFVMWMDHNLLTGLQAFENHSSELYDISNEYQGYFTYGAPFKGFVKDQSVPGATVISGVYIGGSFSATGANGFVTIDFDEGQAIFETNQTQQISGDYAVKDYNIKITDKTEEELLFESKFKIKSDTATSIADTGLDPNVETYPAIFVVDTSSQNVPVAFGGQEETQTRMRAVVVSDSLFSADAVKSMFKDKVRTCFAIFNESDLNNNAFGGFSSDYNYTGVAATKGNSDLVFIDDVRVSSVPNRQITRNNPAMFVKLIDFDLHDYRFPRGTQ